MVQPVKGDCGVRWARSISETKELAALRAEHKADAARIAVLHGELSAKPAEGADIAGAADWPQGPACKRLHLLSAAERERDVREAWCASGVSDRACEPLGHGGARGLRASSSVNPAASRAPQSAAQPADVDFKSSLLHVTGGVASASALAEALAESPPNVSDFLSRANMTDVPHLLIPTMAVFRALSSERRAALRDGRTPNLFLRPHRRGLPPCVDAG